MRAAQLIHTYSRLLLVWLALSLIWSAQPTMVAAAPYPAQATPCSGAHEDVSLPLTDLGSAVYVRMDGENTGQTGGLYPGGANTPPPAHAAAGLALAESVVPLNAAGEPDPSGGRIVLLGIGMSNTALEFRAFRDEVRSDPDVNPRLVAVSGASAGQVAEHWLDPAGPNWQHIADRLRHDRVTAAQVQVAWVKLTRTGGGEFPEKPQQLQADLATVARNLLIHYPNLKLVYFSSRARAFQYWNGLSPEPAAFETGFAVKWLVEQQIEGEAELNYDPARGPVVAPWLAWGPYLWIDGVKPRSDGRVWAQDNLVRDCTHPSDEGVAQVVEMMLAFFKGDPTAQRWFLADPPPVEAGPPLPTATAAPTPTPTTMPADDGPHYGRCIKFLRQCVR